MSNNSYLNYKVNISDVIMVQRFDKGLIRYSFNMYTKEEPLWIHVGISFEAGEFLKKILSIPRPAISLELLFNMVLDSGFACPLDRVIHIDPSDEKESMFEYLENFIWNKPPKFKEEDLYLTYQITYDMKEKLDKFLKEHPLSERFDEMYNILINSDFTFYKFKNGRFSKDSIYNC